MCVCGRRNLIVMPPGLVLFSGCKKVHLQLEDGRLVVPAGSVGAWPVKVQDV